MTPMDLVLYVPFIPCFNTASGMRSHVTSMETIIRSGTTKFQYRKRYEVTCDYYRLYLLGKNSMCFNTASGMRSHVTFKRDTLNSSLLCFNTASGMRSHVTSE